MSEESFKVYKVGKMLDWLESQTTEWAYNLVVEHFDVDEVEQLSEEQIKEVIDQWEELIDVDSTIALGFRNVINQWESANEIYLT